MKRHKPLWLRALATVGIMTTAAGAIVGMTMFRTPGKPTARVGDFFAAIWHAIRVATTHLTTAQLTEAAVLAWLIFVLSLVLLARSRPNEPRTKEEERDTSNAVPVPEAGQAPRPLVTHAAPHTSTPPLPLRSVPVDEASGVHESSRGAQPTRSTGSATAMSAVLDPVDEPWIEDETLPKGVGSRRRGRTLEPTQGHTLALTGVTQARDRLLPYGLFVVAEDAGAAGSCGTASQRAVNIIAEQMASVLAGSLVLGSAQRAALLKMAVLHAGIDLDQQRICTAKALDAAVTAALVIDGTAHIATIGTCRTYRFGIDDGLVQITTDQVAMSQLSRDGPLDREVLHTRPLQDPVYSSNGGSPSPCEVDTCEVHTDPDDLLLLTSPRLWLALPQPRVEAVLRAAPDSRAAARLLAHEAGSRAEGQDFGLIVVRPVEGWMPSFGIAAARAGLL